MRRLYFLAASLILFSLAVGFIFGGQDSLAPTVLSAQQYPAPQPFPLRNPGTIDPTINARHAILIDGDSLYPLYKKDAYIQVPIASTTKMMTALVVMEKFQLTDQVTISRDAAFQIGSTAGLLTNEVLTVESLLKALLIQSGNDAAYALAEHSGTVEGFVARMNEKAEEMGLRSTAFRDPAGLDDGGTSTAFDLAMLGAVLMQNNEIQSITKTPEETISSVDGVHHHRLKNSNRLVTAEMYMDGALGVKTGFTPEAGHVLVAAAKKNGRLLVGVVLSTHEDSKEASAREAKKLLQWGFDTHIWETYK